MVKITLSKKQCESLIKMAFIGSFIQNSTKGMDERNTEIEKCEQEIFRQLYDQGFRDVFEPNQNPLFLNKENEALCMDIIDEYKDDIFWEDLADYLTDRDLSKNYTKEELDRLDEKSFYDLVFTISDQYFEEFENHGIENLVLSSSLPAFLKRT